MYAKLKNDGTIQKAPNPLRLTISNPSDERLEYEGYHRVVESEPPEVPEGYELSLRYEMEGNNIVQVWEIKKSEEEVEE